MLGLHPNPLPLSASLIIIARNFDAVQRCMSMRKEREAVNDVAPLSLPARLPSIPYPECEHAENKIPAFCLGPQ